MSQQVARPGAAPTAEGDPLFSWAAQTIPAPPLPGGYLSSSWFWVGDWDYVLLVASAAGNTSAGARWIVQFADRPDGTVTPAGLSRARTWDVAKSVTLEAGFRVLGPWCQITVYANPSGANATASAAVYGTMAPLPASIVPDGSPLLTQTGLSVAAGATTSIFTDYPYTGPAHFFASFSATALSFTTVLAVAWDGGAYYLDQFQSDAAYRTPRPILIPPRRIRVDFVNQDTVARSFWATLTPLFGGG